MSDFNSGLPVRLHDEDNLAYNANNPLPVSLEESEGDEIHSYDVSAAVTAHGGSSEHLYTVNVGKTFLLTKVLFAGSGRMKIDLLVETGVATDVYDTIATAFSSTAKLSDEINLDKSYKVDAGVKVKVLKTNLDNQDQDLYSTVIGVEK